jgi:RNA polymerase sigma-70 factor, ECF subfamily
MNNESNSQRLLGELLEKNRTAVLGFILSQVSNFKDAEDILQEVYMAVCEKWADFEQGRPFLPWAFGIARHRVQHYYRRSTNRLETILQEDIIEKLAASPEWSVDNADELSAMEQCMKNLQEKLQTMLRLRYFERLGLEDIGHQVGWTRNAVAVAMTRGKHALMKCIEKRMSTEAGAKV